MSFAKDDTVFPPEKEHIEHSKVDEAFRARFKFTKIASNSVDHPDQRTTWETTIKFVTDAMYKLVIDLNQHESKPSTPTVMEKAKVLLKKKREGEIALASTSKDKDPSHGEEEET